MNKSVWFVVVSLLIVGVGRINAGAENLLIAKKGFFHPEEKIMIQGSVSKRVTMFNPPRKFDNIKNKFVETKPRLGGYSTEVVKVDVNGEIKDGGNSHSVFFNSGGLKGSYEVGELKETNRWVSPSSPKEDYKLTEMYDVFKIKHLRKIIGAKP